MKIRRIIGWLLIIGGVGGIFDENYLFGILITLFGISLLPGFYIKTKLNIKNIQIILPMVLWIIILIATPSTTEKVNTNTNNSINTIQKETEFKKEEIGKPKIEVKQQNKTANEELEKPAKEEPKEQIQSTSVQNINDSTNTESSSSGSNNSQGKVIYATPSGKRYHFDPDCGGANSKQIDLESAKSSGLTPCKKCTQ